MQEVTEPGSVSWSICDATIGPASQRERVSAPRSRSVIIAGAMRRGATWALRAIVFIALGTGAAVAQPHFETFRSQDVDPFGILGMHLVDLPDDVRLVPPYSFAGNPVSGRMHIVMPADELAQIEAAGDRQHVRHHLVLTESGASFWSEHFRRRGAPARVPTPMGLLGAIAWPIGLALTAVEHLFSGDDANVITSAQLAALIVPGGQFVTYATVLRSATGEPYMLSETFYYVTVGDAPNWFAIRTTMHAVRVR